MNHLWEAYREAGGDAEEYAKRYLRYLNTVIESVDARAVADFVRRLEAIRLAQRTAFFVGNGGSAATCSHFVNDLSKAGRRPGGPGYRAVSLTDNVPIITAIANDEGYENIFTSQMRDLFAKGDMLVAISASGNSPNVVAAARLARELGGEVVAIVGFDGGELGRISDLVIHAHSENGEYGPVEDLHMILDHLVTSYLAFLSQHGSE